MPNPSSVAKAITVVRNSPGNRVKIAVFDIDGVSTAAADSVGWSEWPLTGNFRGDRVRPEVAVMESFP